MTTVVDRQAKGMAQLLHLLADDSVMDQSFSPYSASILLEDSRGCKTRSEVGSMNLNLKLSHQHCMSFRHD